VGRLSNGVGGEQNLKEKRIDGNQGEIKTKKSTNYWQRDRLSKERVVQEEYYRKRTIDESICREIFFPKEEGRRYTREGARKKKNTPEKGKTVHTFNAKIYLLQKNTENEEAKALLEEDNHSPLSVVMPSEWRKSSDPNSY